MAITIDSVLGFWFGDRERPASVIADGQAALWWGKSEVTDAVVRDEFGETLASAAVDGLDGWLATPEGRLAAIIVVDQFSRNAYRDSGQAFALDPLALGWCREGVESGVDRLLRPIERLFFYLPLEHSEQLADQDLCVRLFEELSAQVPASERETFVKFAEFAKRHQEIIARFGRFPHRNELLGRQSTTEEIAFLGTPGSSF